MKVEKVKGMRVIWNVLKVDIDKDFETMLKNKAHYEEYVNWILEKLGYKVEQILYRKSTNGKTHVYIRLDRAPESWKEYIFLLLVCGDDIGRFNVNMMRLKMFGDPLVKFFAVKLRSSN